MKEESKSDASCSRQTEGAGRGEESLQFFLLVLIWLCLKETWAFDENLISKSTAGPDCTHPAGRLLTSQPAYRSQRVTSSTEEREGGNDCRKDVNNAWRDEQSRRLPVLLLIKAKCFKKERTDKGHTAARMKERKAEEKEAVHEGEYCGGKIRGETLRKV